MRQHKAPLCPSGCRKSTWMNMMAGILPIETSSIMHDGRKVSGINRHVGYMTQQDVVLPWRTVQQNVDLPLRLHGFAAPERRQRVAAMIDAVGLAGFEKSFPAQLSGGLRKRVAPAQLLAYEPDTLLIDQPFGALDALFKLLMQEQLLRIWTERRQTVVFVTHDLAEAITLAQRVVVFSGWPGRIKQIETIPLPAERQVFRVRFLPEFEAALISSPRNVGARLWRWALDGTLWNNLSVTLETTVLGFAIGCGARFGLGLLFGRRRRRCGTGGMLWCAT